MLKRKVNTMIENFNKMHHTAVLNGMFEPKSKIKSPTLVYRDYVYTENPSYSMNVSTELSTDGSIDVCTEVWHVHPEYGVSVIWRDTEKVENLRNLDSVIARMKVCAVGAIATYIF